MAIDASIYGNIQQPKAPDVMGAAEGAMRLGQLGMQQAQMQRTIQQQQLQLQAQQATRQAYADNTDPNTGQVNQQGLLSSLGKNPLTAPQVPELQNQFSGVSKNQAEAQSAQIKSHLDTLGVTLPALQYVNSPDISEDQKPQVFNNVMKQVAQQVGPDAMKSVPQTQDGQYLYDPNWVKTALGSGAKLKQSLDAQLVAAEIGKTKNESDQIGISKGAEELGKFNEDVNNPSSRKITGSLTDTINRSDRIQALANVGAVPGETDQQRIQRLNQVIPQIGQEFSTSLASIMNGGVPPEELQKKLSPDTLQSGLASLQQKFTSQPTAANQGALLNAYVDAAKQLGDFSRGRLQEVTDKSRSAYPYAEKYFPDRMDKIAQPLATPTVGGNQQAGTAAQSQAPTPSVSTAPANSIKMTFNGKTKWIPASMKGAAISDGWDVVK